MPLGQTKTLAVALLVSLFPLSSCIRVKGEANHTWISDLWNRHEKDSSGDENTNQTSDGVGSWWSWRGGSSDDSDTPESNESVRDTIDRWLPSNPFRGGSSNESNSTSDWCAKHPWWPSCKKTTTTTTSLHMNPLRAFFGGFVTGFGYADLAECVAPMNASLAEVEKAFKEYEAKEPVRASAELMLALKNIPSALSSCGAATEDVEKLTSLFVDLMNPKFWTKENYLMLAMNAAETHRKFSAAVAAFKAGDYHAAGRQIAEAILIIFSEPSFPGQGQNHTLPDANGTGSGCGLENEHKIIVADLLKERNPILYNELLVQGTAVPGMALAGVQIAEGIAEGFSMGLDDNECLQSAGELSSSIIRLLKDLVSGNAAGAALAAVQGVETLVPVYESCKPGSGQLKALLHSLEQLRHPKEMLMNMARELRINAIDLTLELSAAALAYRNHDWHRVGLELGKMLSKLVILDTSTSTIPSNTTVGNTTNAV